MTKIIDKVAPIPVQEFIQFRDREILYQKRMLVQISNVDFIKKQYPHLASGRVYLRVLANLTKRVFVAHLCNEYILSELNE